LLEGVPLPLELDDFAAAFYLAVEFEETVDFTLGDGVVDDVVDGSTREGQDAAQGALDDDMLGVIVFAAPADGHAAAE
jgi:hypothetical protein